MRRIVPVVLVFAVVLAAACEASANKLSFSERSFRLSWPAEEPLVIRKATESLRIDDLFHCPVTLEGSFHSSTMRKVVGSLVGQVYRAAVGACVYESSWFQPVRLLETLPWHVTYSAFAGTLPRISLLTWEFTGFAFSGVERGSFGLTCLWRAREANPWTFRATRETTGGALTSVALEGTVEPFAGEGMFCNQAGTVAGPPRLAAAAGGAVTVTLI
jgi:hypothetical protein